MTLVSRTNASFAKNIEIKKVDRGTHIEAEIAHFVILFIAYTNIIFC